MAKRVLAGISWPFRKEGPGLPAPAKGEDVIRSAFRVLLNTGKGSRIRRPTLGTDLRLLVFENTGPQLKSLIEQTIVTACAEFLPQVLIEGVDYREEGNSVFVNVYYRYQGVSAETEEIEIQG